MTQQSPGKNLIMIGFVVLLVIIGLYVLNAPDRRSASEKVGDAINALPDGAEKAARQLEERTPADKLNDAAKDVGDDLKKATNQQ